jgi:putative transposase
MREYHRSAHTVYALHYHFIFIPKYRKPVLRGEVGSEVRDLIREICRTLDILILQGHIRPDACASAAECPAAPCAEPCHAGD